ncbi:MAG: hypothetical protein SH848_01585 [Saprospiraceae bacterium]|nr:hypothetical protein [Saprospiraceae bacterium]MDZ4702588.1 hypothetical protein [Saprospiraceae bacterium]
MDVFQLQSHSNTMTCGMHLEAGIITFDASELSVTSETNLTQLIGDLP